MPAPVHAGGLRYTATRRRCPSWSSTGTWRPRRTQNEVFEAAVQFAKTEGIIPAPESAHAIRRCPERGDHGARAGRGRVILLGLSGHGHFDMQAYDDYLNDRLPEVEFDPAAEEAALAGVPEAAQQGQRSPARGGRPRDAEPARTLERRRVRPPLAGPVPRSARPSDRVDRPEAVGRGIVLFPEHDEYSTSALREGARRSDLYRGRGDVSARRDPADG